MTSAQNVHGLARLKAALLPVALALLCALVSLGSISLIDSILFAAMPASDLVQAPAGAQVAFNLAPLLYALAHLGGKPPDHARRITLLLVIALPLLSAMILMTGRVIAPIAGMTCIALAHALWGGRRIAESARRLEDAFRCLAAEPCMLPDTRDTPPGMALDERLLASAQGAARLRGMQRLVCEIIESLPDAALVVDAAGRVLFGNRHAAALFNAAPPGKLRGQAMQTLLDTLSAGLPDSPAPTWEALQALPGKGAGIGQPDTHRALEVASRAGRSHLARCAVLAAQDGSPAGWIVIFSDIGKLRAAEQARNEILTFLSHDMRSPQSSILALLELHALDPDDNPKEDVHRRIEQYARRTLSLSEQYLQLARAEAKSLETAVEDLGAIVEQAIDEAWADAAQKGVRIEMRWDGEPLPVRADRPLLSRAVLNLLADAVLHSPENGVVTVTVAGRRFGGVAKHVCEVAGPSDGTSPERQAVPFEPDPRHATPDTPNSRAAGLRLALVKIVVEKHGGTIGVVSEPGKGSTSTIVLPAGSKGPDGAVAAM